jgi:hypothetical protein
MAMINTSSPTERDATAKNGAKYDRGGTLGENTAMKAPKKRVGGGLLDLTMLWRSTPDALRKLDPRILWRNPVTASGSGLDPDICPAYAELQVNRIAQARGLSADEVRNVIAANTDGRALGFMGEPSVNVLAVNIALDEHRPGG